MNVLFAGTWVLILLSKRSFAVDGGRTGSAPLFGFRKGFKGHVKNKKSLC